MNKNYIIFIFLLTFIVYIFPTYYIYKILLISKNILTKEKFSTRKKLRMIFNLLIRSGDIRAMTITLAFLCILNMISLLILGEIIYKNKTPDYYMAFSGTISLFYFSLSGFIQYIRKEGVGNNNIVIKGEMAGLSGFLTFVFAGVFAITIFIYGMIDLLN